MAEFLLELFMEEIPARMQIAAGEELQKLVESALKDRGLSFAGSWYFVTPRRLTLLVDGLPLEKPGTSEEKRGPKVGAPAQAIEGFLKSAGLTSLDQCEKRDTGKGEFWFAQIVKPASTTADLLSDIIIEAVNKLSWPKSMRFGTQTKKWVRPLHSILALFDFKIIEGQVDLGGGSVIPFCNVTYGHRFMAPDAIKTDAYANYSESLLGHKVMLDHRKRKDRLQRDIEKLAENVGLIVKKDEGLLDEVVGLTEWPVPLLGKIDRDFMDVPKEALIASMRLHQKFFSLLDHRGDLAPYFIAIANIETTDKGAAIIAGNERVLRARLSDAKFFWDQDKKIPLEAHLPKLSGISFHAKLGTLGDKAERMAILAGELGGEEAAQAARLAKADLVTSMVGEFPELQGIMGGYYANHQKIAPDIAKAIAEHYRPLGPKDECPKAPLSRAVALADKIDSLVGFFAIGEKPTGSKDPYALRRAALGIIRLILENGLRLRLRDILARAYSGYYALGELFDKNIEGESHRPKKIIAELMDFLADRLKVALREQGIRHDLIAAVFALGDEDDLYRLVKRVEALQEWVESEAGKNLLAAYKRATNIVRIEEKKDNRSYEGDWEKIDPSRLSQDEERTLYNQLQSAVTSADEWIKKEQYQEAMIAMAGLRGPVDLFFDKVTVNAEEPALRENRLRLLAAMRAALGRMADFSMIEG